MTEEKKFTCLIIDDEDYIQKVITDILERTNKFKAIYHSLDGIDAGFRLSNQSFDLVIVDKNLPKRDGLTLLKNEILSGRIDPKKIIFLSGLLHSEDIPKIKELKLEHILVKPFKAADITNKINQILKLSA